LEQLHFSNAFYIKLGRGGMWEEDAIATGKLRMGWAESTIEDINAANWKVIHRQVRRELKGKPAGTVSADLNALRRITESSPDDIWITFHQNKMWWTRLAAGKVRQDKTSKYRKTSQPWSDRSLTGIALTVSNLPGMLAQLQGYRATVCRVHHDDLLRRTLLGEQSPSAAAIRSHRAVLANHLAKAIQELHWKDFETLVDLVFRNAGWIRVSVLGQHAKGLDLELIEPIMKDRYIVQVKSRAGRAEVISTAKQFSPREYRRVFFVVHSPDSSLTEAAKLPKHVALVTPERLATMAADAGLTGWIEDKVS
jgi:hypothetical protein